MTLDEDALYFRPGDSGASKAAEQVKQEICRFLGDTLALDRCRPEFEAHLERLLHDLAPRKHRVTHNSMRIRPLGRFP